jgi:hypothetical protein
MSRFTGTLLLAIGVLYACLRLRCWRGDAFSGIQLLIMAENALLIERNAPF